MTKIIGKRELTKEEIEAAKQALERRRATTRTKLASQTFVDRMTSASADPDAPMEQAPADGDRPPGKTE